MWGSGAREWLSQLTLVHGLSGGNHQDAGWGCGHLKLDRSWGTHGRNGPGRWLSIRDPLCSVGLSTALLMTWLLTSPTERIWKCTRENARWKPSFITPNRKRHTASLFSPFGLWEEPAGGCEFPEEGAHYGSSWRLTTTHFFWGAKCHVAHNLHTWAKKKKRLMKQI